MTQKLPLWIRQILPSFVVLGMTLIFLLLLAESGVFKSADRGLGDWLLRLKINTNPVPLNSQVVPIDLNDRTEMLLGERLDDRTAFADLLNILASANTQVALDFIFKASREHDELLVSAARNLDTLILAVIPVPVGRENISYRELTVEEKDILRRHLWHPWEHGQSAIPQAGTFILPFSALADNATLGHIGVESDTDGIYRRTPLFYRWEDGLIPSISLAAAVKELGIDSDSIEIYPGKEIVMPLSADEYIRIPIDEAGRMIIPYTAKWAYTTHRYSFDRIINAINDDELLTAIWNDLARSIVLVADITFEKKDIGPTPFENVYPLSGIHTSVISAVLDASLGKFPFYRELGMRQKWIPGLAVFVLLFLLGLLKKEHEFNSAAGILLFVYTCVVLLLWFRWHIIPWYTMPALWIFLVWIGGFSFRLITRYREQSLLKNALERYFPRSLAQRIIAEGKTELVPVYKELTILFSDISSFTKWSSDKEAAVVHGFLSDYLESMAAILFEHGGTVDKFMGDGILAFFGDPLDLSDHAERSVRAAIAMQKKIQELREKWAPLVHIDLKVRIGINTGRVIVGNLGTKTRIEYTVIGSAVNMAQRMESNATVGGILLHRDTWFLVKDKFRFGGKREIVVKGYDTPIEGYEIIID